MAIELKREYNNGLFEVQEIYDNKHKIWEKTTNHFWNQNFDHPIVIKKSRRGDYMESSIPVEEIKEPKHENNILNRK